MVLGIPNLEPFCQTWVSGLESQVSFSPYMVLYIIVRQWWIASLVSHTALHVSGYKLLLKNARESNWILDC